MNSGARGEFENFEKCFSMIGMTDKKRMLGEG